MQNFEYANPGSLKDALGLLGTNWDETSVLAGGVDLLSMMKDGIATPKRLVNIKNIKALNGISKQGSGVRIGATATLDEVASHQIVRQAFPAIVQAILGISSPQLRNMATVGGNLCQRPRCWYFRSGDGLLATSKKGEPLVPNGENKYHAIFGGGPAYFVAPSSLGTTLVALGATIKVASASGNRDIPAADFFVIPKTAEEREITLKPNEIVTEVVIPNSQTKTAFYEIQERLAVDWPLVTAAVALRMSGSNVSSASVVMGQVAPIPWRASQAEKMLVGKPLTVESAEQAAQAAVANATPLSQNGYKVQLTKVAVKRALLQAAGIQVPKGG